MRNGALIMRPRLKIIIAAVLVFLVSCGIYPADARAAFAKEKYPGFKIRKASKFIYSISGKDEKSFMFFSDGFSSREGYNGKIVLAIVLNEKKDAIRKIFIFSHNETPAYMKIVLESGYLERFEGKKVSSAVLKVESVSGATRNKVKIQAPADTVTGATYTSSCIRDILLDLDAFLKENKAVKKKSR